MATIRGLNSLVRAVCVADRAITYPLAAVPLVSDSVSVPCFLVAACLLLAAACSSQVQTPPAEQAGRSGATVFEGARVITGDGTVIEDGAFVI